MKKRTSNNYWRDRYWSQPVFGLVPPSSPEGHEDIKREMAVYDSLGEDARQAIASAAYNLFPDEVRCNGTPWALCLDGRAQAAYNQKLESGGFNSTETEAEKMRQGILAAASKRRFSNTVQVRNRMKAARQQRLIARRWGRD
jgi:hypothetical protein